MSNCYIPIQNISSQITFHNYVKALDIPFIDYVAVGIQNLRNKESTSLMSCKEWQTYFSDNNFAEYDPIRRAVLYSTNTILTFDNIEFGTPLGTEIMKQRSKFDIKNGIILVTRYATHNCMVTLATGYKNFNSYDFLIKNKSNLKLVVRDLEKIVKVDILD